MKKFTFIFSILAFLALTPVANADTRVATFAGGCFWCMEPPFEALKGVKSAVSGFMGGKKANPTYKEVAWGQTTYLEVVQVTFDPSLVSFEKLLDTFWRNVDPTDPGGQFVDRGPHYRTAIFFHSADQKRKAEISKNTLAASKRFKKKIVTEIRKAGPFYAAEDYHQDYYKKSKVPYKRYRRGSGRDEFLRKHWKK
jgi:methionine-S-sulfoxide reductase